MVSGALRFQVNSLCFKYSILYLFFIDFIVAGHTFLSHPIALTFFHLFVLTHLHLQNKRPDVPSTKAAVVQQVKLFESASLLCCAIGRLPREGRLGKCGETEFT